MSTYVVVRESEHSPTGKSYVGPLPTLARAEREAQAWRDCGQPAEVAEYTPALKAEVRAWEKAKKARASAVR